MLDNADGVSSLLLKSLSVFLVLFLCTMLNDLYKMTVKAVHQTLNCVSRNTRVYTALTCRRPSVIKALISSSYSLSLSPLFRNEADKKTVETNQNPDLR